MFRHDVQCQVDAAGDAGRGMDAVVADVQDVPGNLDVRELRCESVLEMVMGGRASPGEEPRLGEGECSLTDADDGPAAVMVLDDAVQERVAEPAGGLIVPALPAGDNEDIVASQRWPVSLCPKHQSLCGMNIRGFRDIGQWPGVRDEVISGAEDLRRPRDVQEVDTWSEKEYHLPDGGADGIGHGASCPCLANAVVTVSTVAISANRPARANSVRSMMSATGSVSPVSGRVAGKVAVASVTKVTR